MSTKKMFALLFLSFLFISVPTISAAAGGGEKETAALNQKVDTSKLTGINRWVAEMYNGDRVLYAIVVTLVMAALGTSLAFLTDLILKSLGLEVSRISHRE